MHLRYCCRASTSPRMGDPGAMPAIRRHPKNGLAEMPLTAIGQCISSKRLQHSDAELARRPARLSSLGSSGRAVSSTSIQVRTWMMGGWGIREVSAASGIIEFSRYICFFPDQRRHRGVKPSRRFRQDAVLAVPARLALLNILWRIPLSIFTAYGLTA